ALGDAGCGTRGRLTPRSAGSEDSMPTFAQTVDEVFGFFHATPRVGGHSTGHQPTRQAMKRSFRNEAHSSCSALDHTSAAYRSWRQLEATSGDADRVAHRLQSPASSVDHQQKRKTNMSKTRFQTIDTHTLANVSGGTRRAQAVHSQFSRGFQQ